MSKGYTKDDFNWALCVVVNGHSARQVASDFGILRVILQNHIKGHLHLSKKVHNICKR